MRERWFYVKNGERSEPLSLAELAAALRREREPRAALVWRRGMAQWTPAEAVPELVPELAAPVAAGAVAATPSVAARRATTRVARVLAVLGIVALIVGLVAVLAALRLRSEAPRALAGGTPASPFPALPRPLASAGGGSAPLAAPSLRNRAPARPASVPVLADAEAELPSGELHKLRGVAAWSGETLKLTVYNATAWRLTELHVRIERYSGDDFVVDERPTTLLPQAPRVDAGVADLLARVAPDRKRPGLNALDTGAFEGRAGAAPEGFRWQLESARGYPPAR